MIWAKEETLPRDEIEAIQYAKLKGTVRYIYDRVKPYRDKMDAAKVKPEDIRSLDDLLEGCRLHIRLISGTTTRTGFLQWIRKRSCVITPVQERQGSRRLSDIRGMIWTCGSTTWRGSPVWAARPQRMWRRSHSALGLHGGLEKVGASVIPMSSGNTNKQIMFLQDMGVTLLVATPSYALHLGEEIRNRGIDPQKDLKLHIGLFGGEGMTEPMRDEMHKVWGEQFFCTQNYGMSELCGPGVAGECSELCGMHINEDWFIPEVIDPETEEVLPPGELGELVVTCLGKEALPLVRYRTGDLTRLMYEPCKCGRTTCRMENISGRADDMLVIRGVNVFPTQIEEVLLKIEEIGPHYEILVERRNRLDVMTITVELIDDRLLDSYGKLSELEARIKKALKAQLGLATQIRLVAPNSLKRFEGKAKRVTDLRKDGL